MTNANINYYQLPPNPLIKNPLGLDATSEVLLFEADTDESDRYLSNQLLYPDNE